MTGQLWRLTGSDGHGYALGLDGKENFYIINEDTKMKLTYLDAVRKWFGRDSNGKAIIIEWPTFRDIVEKIIAIQEGFPDGSES